MSSEGGASQSAGAGSDKPQGLKPAPGFSSFINKSGAGKKKFAPKVARRRPGNANTTPATTATPAVTAAPNVLTVPAILTPQSSDVPPAASSTEPSVQAIPTSESTPQSSEPALPTPAVTQEVTSSSDSQAPQVESASLESTATPVSSILTPEATPAPFENPQTLAPSDKNGALSQQASSRLTSPGFTEIDSNPGGSTDGHRVEKDVSERLPTTTGAVETAVMVAPTVQNNTSLAGSFETQTQSISSELPDDSTARTQGSTETRQESDGTAEAGAASETQAAEVSQSTELNGTTSQNDQQWNAVNRRTQEGEEPTATDVTPRSTRKRKRNIDSNNTTEGVQDGEDANPEQSAKPRTRRTRAKATQQTAEPGNEGGDNANEGENATSSGFPTRKARKPRKDKGTTRRNPDQREEAGEQDTEEAAPRPKKRKTTRKKKDASAQAAEGSEPRRRGGRPPREPTPSDAENEMIDPSSMQMTGLSRDIRKGRVSERERKMRLINWDEVRQRWREEAAMDITKGPGNAVDAQLDEAGEAREAATTQQPTGPTMQIINGEIVWAQSAGNTQQDRDADIDRELDAMVEVQEDDLTTRITSRSFIKSNKRYPNEFILPGQGARWTVEGTEQFYDALQTFGTDFALIATLFPGMPRRSLKTKFNREERENPDRIRRVLNGPRDKPDWEGYMAQVGRTQDSYVDAQRILKELEEEEKALKRDVEAAMEVAAEEKRQRIAAGLDVEESDAGGDENGGAAGKKKKGKKNKKEKQVAFAVEEGVEVVDDVEGFSD